MSFLRRLLGSAPGPSESASDQEEPAADERATVTAWVRLYDAGFGNEREEQRVFELENRIIAAVDAAHAGAYDTNELANGAFGMRILTTDADATVALLRPLLASAPPGSYLTVKQAGAGGAEERVEIQQA